MQHARCRQLQSLRKGVACYSHVFAAWRYSRNGLAEMNLALQKIPFRSWLPREYQTFSCWLPRTLSLKDLQSYLAGSQAGLGTRTRRCFFALDASRPVGCKQANLLTEESRQT